MKHSYLKVLGYTEGSSLLLLLFIAMPLKYIWHEPQYTRALGTLHGFLFVVYVLTLAASARDLSLTRKQLLWGLILACVPFGPFFFHRRH